MIQGFHFKCTEAGLEPARANAHRILSPACLPIPPLERRLERETIRTRDPDLGKVVLYQLSILANKTDSFFKVSKFADGKYTNILYEESREFLKI